MLATLWAGRKAQALCGGFRLRNLCRDKKLNGQSDLELRVSDPELGNRLPECHSPSPLAHAPIWKSPSPTAHYSHDPKCGGPESRLAFPQAPQPEALPVTHQPRSPAPLEDHKP